MLLATLGGWSQTKFTRGASKDYSVQLKKGESTNAKYFWSVTPGNGTSTSLDLIESNAATIMWDGIPGVYTLSVQVIDGNGCLSESISQEIEIVEPGDLIFDSAFSNTIVCSDLAGGAEGSVSEHNQSIFQIIYSGNLNLKLATINIKNPEGIYVDINGIELGDQQNPQVVINNIEEDKVIDVAVSDSWENNSDENVLFEITIISGKDSNDEEVLAEEGNDIKRVITILPKPVIGF